MGRGRRASHEDRAALLAALGALPAVVTAITLLFVGDHSGKIGATLAAVVVVAWACAVWNVRSHVAQPLGALANLLAALREGDFSLRLPGARRVDTLGEAVLEANMLADRLQNQHWQALEATALLRKVMEEIDVVVLAFDDAGKAKLANPAAERLLGAPVERILGRTARDLGLQDLLEGDVPRVAALPIAGSAGRWEIRRRDFRQGGAPHVLLVLSNVQRALREEESNAWRRLVRVLGHEVNNSLTPIQSLARTAGDLLKRSPPPADRDADVGEALAVIARRAEGLTRFMGSYSQWARLAPPTLRPVELRALVQRVAGLENRVPMVLADGDPILAHVDGDQLEQALINLIKNAADASPPGSPVSILVERRHDAERGRDSEGGRDEVVIRVTDAGPGLGDTKNLFVPFFTTKPGGTGIGLVLARQIAEGHGGTLTLSNRTTGGCEARLTIPIGGPGMPR